jgi:uncharacterized protein YjbI with pentapeptide repeats
MSVPTKVDQKDTPLTRGDVECLLQKAGSPDKLELIGLNLREINLVGFNLEGVNLSEANLFGAILSGANLSRAVLRNTNLFGAVLSGVILSHAVLSCANLSKAILNIADLRQANLSEANFWGADLKQANLSQALLYRADLREANLFGADLWGADLRNAKLFRADLRQADLREANLFEADLRQTILREVHLRGTDLKEIIGADRPDKPKTTTVESSSTFRIRIVEEPLTPHNLTSSLSVVTDLFTRCWLMANRRFADLAEYTKTHDASFAKEAQLFITRITYNTLFDVSLYRDISLSNLTDAMKTIIAGIAQVKLQLEQGEQENQTQDREGAGQESKAILLKQGSVIEREYAIEIAAKAVALLHPNEDEETKALLIETLWPLLVELQHGKRLEFVLPAPFTHPADIQHTVRAGPQSPEKFTFYDDGVYCTAGKAARTLSEKLGRPISVNYIHKLAYRKKHPVRIQYMGDRLLYHLDDIENATIKARKSRKEEESYAETVASCLSVGKQAGK